MISSSKKGNEMALTRKMLRAMSIDDEKIDQIIEAHGETVDALKQQRDAFKADAERIPTLEQELSAAKKQFDDSGSDSYKEKYEALFNEFNDFKATVSKEKEHIKKQNAYRDLLKAAGVDDKRLDTVLKVSDFNSIEFDDDGNVQNSDDLTKSIQNEWSDFISTQKTNGAKVDEPPTNKGGADDVEETFRHALGLD